MTTAQKLKVLIAEDEPAMLSLLSRHVKGLGFHVVEASDGDAAWQMAQEHRPDLVLLDVMMPGMSGWEVCKRIKSPTADGAFTETGVIMLTGIGESLNDMTSPLFQADGWLNKPFDFPDLDAKVREVLGQYAKALPHGAPASAHDDEPGEAPAASGVMPQAKNGAAKANGASKHAKAKKVAAKVMAAKAAKKPAAKKAAAKGAAKKTAAKKPAAKKAVTKTASAKAAPAKGGAAKKPAAKKAAAKKPAAKKATRRTK